VNTALDDAKIAKMSATDPLAALSCREEGIQIATQHSVLQGRNLQKSFGNHCVLDDVTVDLRQGEVVLLRGENGSGKTTLLNILTGNIEPDQGTIRVIASGTEEYFRFPRPWWQDLNAFDHFTPERVASEAIGRTWQDVRLFQTQTLLDNLAVATPDQPGENPLAVLLSNSRTRAAERNNRGTASAVLSQLGLAGREDSSADRISLGQTKRVAIGRAIRAGARILFLDEPLAGVDGKGILTIMELLTSLARDEQVTLVIVEHALNIPRVLDLADTVWTLSNSHLIVEQPSEVRNQLRGLAADGLMPWLKSMAGPNANYEEQDLGNGARLTRFHAQSIKNQKALLELRDVVVRRGNRLVIGCPDFAGDIKGISFKIYEGDLAVFHAPNGWGKTTLLEALLGIIPMEQGELLFDNMPIKHLSVWERVRRGIAILQARDNFFRNLTVKETLRLCNQTSSDTSWLSNLFDRQVASLSGGERQRVAMSLLKPARLGIYDEPFSALDLSRETTEALDCYVRRHEATIIFLPILDENE